MRRRPPFYRHPVYQAILVAVVAVGVYIYLTFRLGGVNTNLVPIVVDVVLLIGGIFLWLAFFSQFVLPVLSLNERRLAFGRLLNYLFGGHGPAVFIENGDVQHHSQEMRRRGPGVILVDTASAGVLRNAVAFTRPIGPGIVFTEGNEYLAGVVDLHIQNSRIGPKDEDDPFVPQGKDEPVESYQGRQERRWVTSGLTRDGVEVVPNISASFKLVGRPGEGGSMYGYNPEGVWNAIAREGIDPDAPSDARSRKVPWNWLPVYLAADLWREYLRKFVLNELFVFATSPSAHDPATRRRTAFETIVRMVHKRMTQPEVEDYDDVGRPTGEVIASREYEILVKRGLVVHSVAISNLRFPGSVEEELIKQWKATWLSRSQEEKKYVDRRRSREKLLGEETALLDFADAASQFLGPRVRDKSSDELPDISETLELLVRGTLNQSIRDPDLHPRLKTEKTNLVELREWIRRN